MTGELIPQELIEKCIDPDLPPNTYVHLDANGLPLGIGIWALTDEDFA